MNKSKKDKKIIFEINVNNSLKVKNWEKENQKAINSYNERIKKNGLFSDGLRQF
jgi:post-segregation antitoxin (ccd killing protein)